MTCYRVLGVIDSFWRLRFLFHFKLRARVKDMFCHFRFSLFDFTFYFFFFRSKVLGYRRRTKLFAFVYKLLALLNNRISLAFSRGHRRYGNTTTLLGTLLATLNFVSTGARCDRKRICANIDTRSRCSVVTRCFYSQTIDVPAMEWRSQYRYLQINFKQPTRHSNVSVLMHLKKKSIPFYSYNFFLFFFINNLDAKHLDV